MGKRKRVVGYVVSDKMDKTVVVRVDRLKKHPLYKKYIRRKKHFYAHDEHNECRVNDKVLIEETRPLSRLKRWRVVRILERFEGNEKPSFVVDETEREKEEEVEERAVESEVLEEGGGESDSAGDDT